MIEGRVEVEKIGYEPYCIPYDGIEFGALGWGGTAFHGVCVADAEEAWGDVGAWGVWTWVFDGGCNIVLYELVQFHFGR